MKKTRAPFTHYKPTDHNRHIITHEHQMTSRYMVMYEEFTTITKEKNQRTELPQHQVVQTC